MNTKLISVVIPVYNGEKYIERCVTSIINQSYKNLEIIIVDDGSKDRSLTICQEMAKIDSRIKVISQRNKGVSSARNNGLSHCSGDYISFVDSDDTIEYNFLEVLIKNLLKTNSDISVCGYNIVYNDSIIKNYNGSILNEITDKNEMFQYLLQQNFRGFSWNKLYDKRIINDILFDENIAILEDLLFVSKLFIKSKKICYTNKKLYNYFQNSNSVMHSKVSEKYIGATLAYKEIIDIIEQYKLPIVDKYIYELFCFENDAEKNGFNVPRDVCRDYKILLKSKSIKIYKKIEIFIRYRMYNLYLLLKKIKNK